MYSKASIDVLLNVQFDLKFDRYRREVYDFINIHMISNHNIYRKFCIDIITYKSKDKSNNNNMTSKQAKKSNDSENKFICSVCLNQKCANDIKTTELNERKSKSCPVCQNSYNSSIDGDSTVTKGTEKTNSTIIKNSNVTRDAQTSQHDVTQGLSLLNEVLNVFQNKKQINYQKERRKTIIFKDIGVSTDETVFHVNVKPKLTLSKVFQYSIDDKCGNENKFIIVSSSQPDTIFMTRKSENLIKHKSSSIPQMKLEELKHSLKEKTKSKDAMEEASRMFATVKRLTDKDSDCNRPMIRNGPRVLPVVKTGNFEDTVGNNPKTSQGDHNCKCCQQSDIKMSSGDSSEKHKCCYSCKKYVERCDDCVYMMCCHYKQNKQQTREIICKRCRAHKNES